jgi:hypothetical protein
VLTFRGTIARNFFQIELRKVVVVLEPRGTKADVKGI